VRVPQKQSISVLIGERYVCEFDGLAVRSRYVSNKLPIVSPEGFVAAPGSLAPVIASGLEMPEVE
jgi:hypothetical protein